MSWSAQTAPALVPALLITAVAAQEPRTDPATSALTGWLQETLDGDVAAAIRTYERGMRSSLLDPEQRALAALRRLEIARIQGDEATIHRCLQLTSDASREYYRRRRGTPTATAELRSALANKDPTRLATARRRFIDEMVESNSSESNRSLRAEWSLQLRGRIYPRGITAPTPPTTESADSPPPNRVRLSLPPPANSESTLRLRAAQIAALHLRNRTEEAGRLEADLVARLLDDDPLRPCLRNVPDEVEPPSDADETLASSIRELDELLNGGRLTPVEQSVLGSIHNHLRRLHQAGQTTDALRLLHALPYELPGSP